VLLRWKEGAKRNAPSLQQPLLVRRRGRQDLVSYDHEGLLPARARSHRHSGVWAGGFGYPESGSTRFYGGTFAPT
jgi:hypothetical protein